MILAIDASIIEAAAVAGGLVISLAALAIALLARRDAARSATAAERSATAAEATAKTDLERRTDELRPRIEIDRDRVKERSLNKQGAVMLEMRNRGPVDCDEVTIEILTSSDAASPMVGLAFTPGGDFIRSGSIGALGQGPSRYVEGVRDPTVRRGTLFLRLVAAAGGRSWTGFHEIQFEAPASISSPASEPLLKRPPWLRPGPQRDWPGA